MSNKIFISWHNDKQGIGKRISNCFHEYLNKIFGKYLKAFSSNVDITEGWYDELSKALKNGCQYAIFILTPQALDSMWMSYEYGALRQITDKIWCFRFGDVSNDKTPFAINQHLPFSVEQLNKVLGKIVTKELDDSEIEWEEADNLKNKIKTFVPQLYSDVKAIASQIEKYVCNNTLRQMIETQELLQENEELKNRIKVLETQCVRNIIDLELPSGTLWADRNIGASSPEDYGYYFAWGETEPKDGNYDADAYTFLETPKNLPTANDAASVYWGCYWCIPTVEQFNELLENCKWEWWTRENTIGVLFTSKINYRKIFFPAAGVKWPKLENEGKEGYYWTSSIYDKGVAYHLRFYQGKCDLSFYYRHFGFSIRAVQKKNDL